MILKSGEVGSFSLFNYRNEIRFKGSVMVTTVSRNSRRLIVFLKEFWPMLLFFWPTTNDMPPLQDAACTRY